MRIVVVLAIVIVLLVVVMVIIVVVVEVVVYILLWRRRVDTTSFVNFHEKNVCRLGLFASIASEPQFKRRDFENFHRLWILRCAVTFQVYCTSLVL